MKKLMFVFGTRPEVIKVAPVIREAKLRGMDVSVVSTGQHRQMIDPILKGFSISADYDLNLMKPNQSLNDISTAVLGGLREILAKERPDLVLVQGDTTSAAIAALCCFHERVEVAHIEAGLRTNDISSPWPEEFNRRLVGLVAKYHFGPTDSAKANLLREGVKSENILVTGNTSIDALIVSAQLDHGDLDRKFANIRKEKKLILATLHRRENFGKPLRDLLLGIKRLLDEGECQVILPLHMNPQVRSVAREVLGTPMELSEPVEIGNLIVTPPLEYFEFVYVMKRAFLIITDSGGVQEEAPCLGKPLLIARESTERQEVVDCGQGILIGSDPDRLFVLAKELLSEGSLYKKMAVKRDVFGDGKAAGRIIDFLLRA